MLYINVFYFEHKKLFRGKKKKKNRMCCENISRFWFNIFFQPQCGESIKQLMGLPK